MSNREGKNQIGERLFSYLTTTFYYRFRKLKGWEYGKLKHEPIIRFGGYFLEEFYFNKETKQTEIRQGFHQREPLLVLGDNFPVLTSTIYLNELFLYCQLGLRHYYEEKSRFEKHFDFKVLAHEIISCDTNWLLSQGRRTWRFTQEVSGRNGKTYWGFSWISRVKEILEVKIFTKKSKSKTNYDW